MAFLALLGGIGSTICWVLVLIQLFSKEGAMNGILGVICGLYAFIWGWSNEREVGRGVMIAWSICMLVSPIARLAS